MAARLDIRISKESEVPVRHQLAEQIAFLIGTGRLKPGEIMPSVRTLGRKLKIHHNTISQAYQDLVERTMLVSKRGSRMAVRSLEPAPSVSQVKDLDDLINATISAAQEQGYTLQQLTQRVRERLLSQPPDHLLVVDEETGLRQLIREELKEKSVLPIETCSPSDLPLNPALPIGALVVCHEGARRNVAPLLPKDRPIFTIRFSTADEHVEMVRKLQVPSIIAVVSVSEQFLRTARGLLAPVLGRRHTLREFFLPEEKFTSLRAADVVFCDSIARRQVKAARVVHYRLVSSASLESFDNAMRSLNPS